MKFLDRIAAWWLAKRAKSKASARPVPWGFVLEGVWKVEPVGNAFWVRDQRGWYLRRNGQAAPGFVTGYDWVNDCVFPTEEIARLTLAFARRDTP